MKCCILYLSRSALMAMNLFFCYTSYYDTTYPCSQIHHCGLWIHYNHVFWGLC